MGNGGAGIAVSFGRAAEVVPAGAASPRSSVRSFFSRFCRVIRRSIAVPFGATTVTTPMSSAGPGVGARALFVLRRSQKPSSQLVRTLPSGKAEMLPFDLMTVFRTPYRIDIVQPVYFVIESFSQVAASLDADVGAMIDEAKRMGDLPARFEKAA